MHRPSSKRRTTFISSGLFLLASNRDFQPSCRSQAKGISEPFSPGKQEGGSGEAPLMAESDKLIFSPDPGCSPSTDVSCSALAASAPTPEARDVGLRFLEV